MLLVSVLFTENINVSDGFWGLTKNSVLKLWYENNVELYKSVDAPRKPKRKSGETEDDWKQRMTVYKAKLTNWSTKTEEANKKYRQMKNKEHMRQRPLSLSCRSQTVPLLSMICTSFWLHLERSATVILYRCIKMWVTRMLSSSRISGIALSTPSSASL